MADAPHAEQHTEDAPPAAASDDDGVSTASAPQPQLAETSVLRPEHVVMCSAKVTQAFGLLSEAVNGEAAAYEEDLKLLAAINDMLAKRYGGMTDRVLGVKETLAKMIGDHGRMQTGLGQIDALEISLQKLESVVEQLDSYSRRLEQRLLLAAQDPPS
eukprot:TRINITY_DN40376_c0_g1_i1.p2 TRINITY_DN40376_c0_g1~~TRINITY_DN40376_c0_g1_i1.p2  ORF type:complete len:158 (+),score=46.35 TRINITY_DN40376_c0_g1_i1:56-529(+)